ncbi:DUF6855 family protein [Archangium sp. Cb G35]|uniref:DUF6855 family protein n=1 Tax=Archangium sp. Cb G35 TaxID=1920190 RepID=UPI000A89F6EB|nr:hypothetical protein [Archangium sp. Cb G35]
MAAKKKPAAKKTPAKKVAVKQPAAKKTPAKKTPAKQPAAKKTPAKKQATGSSNLGTRERPWTLKTPPGTSEFEAFRDDTLDPPALIVRVGKTELRYHLRCIDDLHALLVSHGDWMPLGGADEQKPAPEGSVEAWGRSPKNPMGGWYGLKKGLRGRFGVYVPPVLEALGLAEVEHQPRNNRMRARSS